MKTQWTALGAAAALVFAALPLAAQDSSTVAVAESDEYGQHLVDSEGRALYMFDADTQGGDQMGETVGLQIACNDACLENWPLYTVSSKPTAGEGVDENLLKTTDYEGDLVVTYNGWPLYHFAGDEGSGDTNGQEVEAYGGEWYLVTPEGEELEGDSE